MSMALGALKNRKMLPDDSLVPWTSPDGNADADRGRGARASRGPTSPTRCTPNGSTLDYVADAPYRGRVGVEKQSLVGGLYVLRARRARLSTRRLAPTRPPTSPAGATSCNAGEPYDGDPRAGRSSTRSPQHHSSYYIDHSIAPAPMLISNGFTDDLFPVDEAIRFYNRTRTQYAGQPTWRCSSGTSATRGRRTRTT